jgi:hypothetical protein
MSMHQWERIDVERGPRMLRCEVPSGWVYLIGEEFRPVFVPLPMERVEMPLSDYASQELPQ